MNLFLHLIKTIFDISRALIGTWLLFVVVMIVIMMSTISLFTRWIWTDKWALAYLELASTIPYEFSITNQWIRYITIWDVTKTPLLLIHGWFWWVRHRKDFSRIEELYKKYYLIIVERPWYTSQVPSIQETTAQEVALYEEILEDLDQVIIFWISYWAAPALLLCHVSSSCTHFVGWAGAYIPEHHKTYLWLQLTQNSLFKAVLPDIFYTTAQENIHKESLLEDMIPVYESFDKPTLLFHALDDQIVPYANSSTLLELIPALQKKLIRTDGVRHQIQDAIPRQLYHHIDEFVAITTTPVQPTSWRY